MTKPSEPKPPEPDISPRPTRQKEQSAESRERLLKAAATVFARQGFHRASLRAIGEESGISRGSIVWHFGTKDALLLAVVERTFLAWTRSVSESDIGTLTGLAAIFAVVDAHERFIGAQPDANRLYYSLLAEVSTDAALTERVATMHAEGYHELRRHVVVAMRAGEIRADLDPDVSVRLIYSMLGGIGHQAILVPIADIAPVYAELKNVMLQALTTSP